MKFRLLLLFLLLIAIGLAQGISTPSIIPVSTTPSGTCFNSGVLLLMPTGVLYTCQSGNWAPANSAGSSGVSSLSGLTGALNITGTNITVTPSGSTIALVGLGYPGSGIANSTGSAWGTSYSTSGSGNVCLTTSCVMITPNLGTPSALVLTNATGLPLSTGVTGNLSVNNLNGGTSASSSTFWRGDGTWAAPTGSGTVTVVGSGNLTSTAIVTGGGSQTIQTPNSSATLDSSGNAVLLSVTTGFGSGAAGFHAFGQGTAPVSLTANAVTLYAPTSVTTQARVFASSPYTGLPMWTNSSGTMTEAAATAANIVSLFSTCSGTQYLGADGSCHTASGSGTVTSSGSPVSGNIPKFTTATNIAPAAYSDIVTLWASGSCSGFLKNDGTCATGGTGNVSTSGSPAQYQVAIWASGTTILGVTPSSTSGVPLISQGSSANPAFGAINLAGGSSIVTGTLPAANVAALSGTTAVGSLTIPSSAGSATFTQTIATGTTAASGTGSLNNLGPITSTSCATLTISASGVASTDVIEFTPNAALGAVAGFTPATTGGMTIQAYPTSGNVVFQACNWSTGSLTIGTGAALNWRVSR